MRTRFLSTLLLIGCGSGGGTSPDAGGAGADIGASAASKPHVLLLSIDGLHGRDLERYIAGKPASTLATLAAQGTRYADVSTPFPSDSFPGIVALVTGGTPRTTGIYYDLSYDRTLSPPDSADCSKRGAVVDYTELADKDSTKANGGGALDQTRLPRDPMRGCQPLLPHQFLRVNTIFEVIKAAGLRTAWTDKHLSYEVVEGPSGTGVDDMWNPEVASGNFNKVVDAAIMYDGYKIDALLAQIMGKDHTGTTTVGVPAVLGMDFQAVSVAQKQPGGGYKDAAGTPSDALAQGLDSVDRAIGKLVAALDAQGLSSRTLLVVAAAHGQAPVDPALVKVLPSDLIPGLVNQVQPDLLAQATLDDVALLWLRDGSKTAAVAAKLQAEAASAGIDEVVWGDALAALLPDARNDPRAPDLVVVPKPGVLYAPKDNKIAEHGGTRDDDRKVALLLYGAGVPKAQSVSTPVETRQVAPTVLAALGLDPQRLQAVQKEGTAVLPGLALGAK